MDRPDDAELDGCDVDLSVDATPDEHVDYVVLFAEGLDENDPTTIQQAKADWEELFG